MRRIIIDSTVQELADQFREELAQYNLKNALRILCNNESDSCRKRYVEAIIDQWDSLIVAKPDEWTALCDEFDRIGVDVVSGRYYEKIVCAMQYKKVQHAIFPLYVSRLGIKACVYCNAQYVTSNPLRKHISYEIDHFLPKSIFPFLSTSFYNLYPCCSTCNRHKNNHVADKGMRLFQLYASNPDEELNPVHFTVTPESIVEYIATYQPNALSIQLDARHNQELVNGMNHFFHLDTLYQAHKDVVEELIWKKQIYNQSYIEQYAQIFDSLGLTKSNLLRFVLGNYATENEVNKRPLSQMVQDVAKQLSLI